MKIELSKNEEKKIKIIVYLFLFGFSALSIPILFFAVHNFLNGDEIRFLMNNFNAVMELVSWFLLLISCLAGVALYFCFIIGNEVLKEIKE